MLFFRLNKNWMKKIYKWIIFLFISIENKMLNTRTNHLPPIIFNNWSQFSIPNYILCKAMMLNIMNKFHIFVHLQQVSWYNLQIKYH